MKKQLVWITLVGLGILLLSPLNTAHAATLTVNTTSGTFDGVCNAAHCSLADAIDDANATPALDTIAFNIPGTGNHTIYVNSTSLPNIDAPVILDATTQPGYAGTPVIRVSGSSGDTFSFDPGSSGSTIREFLINNYSNIGITLFGSDNTVIEGNYIGTNFSGTAAVGSGVWGIYVVGSKNTRIGGPDPEDRNLISGSYGGGMMILTDCDGTLVRGNYIGTNAAGNAAIPNGIGIALNYTSLVTIGPNNVISGNTKRGIFIYGGISGGESNSNVIRGNRIGITATGNSPLPNGEAGVQIQGKAHYNFVGGPNASDLNIIAYNDTNGVEVISATDSQSGTLMNPIGNVIQRNHIFRNDGLGIDLASDGITLNDVGDADSGPNYLQNFPVLTTAIQGLIAQISGTLSSVAVHYYHLDFFASGVCDPSGNGEGGRYLGSTTLWTDSSGFASFNVTSGLGILNPGEFVTATATDLTVHGGTSEFSTCITASAP